MISQCIYCERTFRTNDEERDWCDDCEDEAMSESSFDNRGGTGHGDESLSDADPGL